MKKKLLAIGVVLSVLLFTVPLMAGSDLNLKVLNWQYDTILTPGFGFYDLNIGTLDVGWFVEHNFASLTWDVTDVPGGRDVWELEMAGIWDTQIFYDIDLGGCDPGPCQNPWAIRLGAGLGIPAVLRVGNVFGLEIDAPEIGIIISAGLVAPTWTVQAEAYYNGDDVGFMLSAHMDLFRLTDWIRGSTDKAVAIE